MKTINIYPIRSVMSHDNSINLDSKLLLDSIKTELGEDFEFRFIDEFNETNRDDFSLILVQSGGSEGIFKKEIYSTHPGPFYLLTYGSNNSLAASLEILTFLKQNGIKSEVLHGNNEYIANRIRVLINEKRNEKLARLGVFGVPSDWLISSDVNYSRCEDILNIELVDVPQEEIIEAINAYKDKENDEAKNFEFNQKEINKALNIYKGLKDIVIKYRLDGFTIRCFDIIQIVKSSACLALALFNKENIIASCEGDIPAMLTAYLIQKVTGKHSFQCNPQFIDPTNNVIELAHCTLPLDMCKKVTYDTHFESGIGVGLHGEFDLEKVTIVKINSELNEFYLETGEIYKNEYRKDRCRTQIGVRLNANASYFLRGSLGNHHLIVLGDKKEKLQEHFYSLGLRKIEF